MFFVLIFEYIILILFSYIFRRNKDVNYFWVLSAIIFIVTLCIYNPNSSMDLFRYNTFLDEYRKNGLEYALNQYYFKYSPLYPLYFYFISRFTSNRMLMLVTSGLVYYIIFRMLIDAKKTMNLTAFGQFWCFLSILLFVDMLNITGIRSMLGTVIATAGFYQDINNRKKSAIILYIVGGLLHASVWVIGLMKIVSVLMKKRFAKIYTLSIITFLVFAAMTGMLEVSQLILEIYNNSGVGFFYALGWQMISYMGRIGSTANSIILYYVATLLRMVALMISFAHSGNDEDKKYYKYSYIPASIIALAIGIIRIPTACVRFFIIANVLSIPLLWRFFNPIEEIKIKNNDLDFLNLNVCKYRRNKILTCIVLESFLAQALYLFYFQYSQFGCSFNFM